MDHGTALLGHRGSEAEGDVRPLGVVDGYEQSLEHGASRCDEQDEVSRAGSVSSMLTQRPCWSTGLEVGQRSGRARHSVTVTEQWIEANRVRQVWCRVPTPHRRATHTGRPRPDLGNPVVGWSVSLTRGDRWLQHTVTVSMPTEDGPGRAGATSESGSGEGVGTTPVRGSQEARLHRGGAPTTPIMYIMSSNGQCGPHWPGSHSGATPSLLRPGLLWPTGQPRGVGLQALDLGDNTRFGRR